MIKSKKFKVGVAISALAHLALLLAVPYFLPDASLSRAQSLQVWLEPRPKPKTEKKPEWQVVSMVPKSPTAPPADAKYRAEFDQKVDVEQKAQNHPSPPKKPRAAKKGEHLAKTTLGPGSKKTPGDPLGIRPNFEDESFAMPSSDDYLPDVAEGNANKLNTLQWQHAPFFNRMREKIKSVWSPQEQINRYDPKGDLLGQNNRATIIGVTLDRDGGLKELFVKDPSGVAYLDEEALRAFKDASPFLFPPKELFDERGEFSFTFAFHLQINRGFSLNFE